jgi:hypothetical protein
MKSYVLKLTSAIAIDGQIHKAGALVEVSEAEAKNFLHRGKAVLATAEDGVEQGGELTGTDYSSWTKAALLEHAKANGIEVASGMTKDQIIDVIEVAPASADDDADRKEGE